MTTEQVRRYHGATPFSPFRVHVADGPSFNVSHPEILNFSASGRVIFVDHGDGRVEVIDLLLVTSLEVSETAPLQSPPEEENVLA